MKSLLDVLLDIKNSSVGNEIDELNETSPPGLRVISSNSFISSFRTSKHRSALNAAGLYARYEERAGIVEHDGDLDRAVAEARAWHEVAGIWWRQHGSRVWDHLCAGCGRPLGDSSDVLLLPHGERAHAGEAHQCVLAYGRRWKREAAAALAEIGIPAPPEVAAEIEGESETRMSATNGVA
jgi:hypothetical protein